jgi:hypothetical protein
MVQVKILVPDPSEALFGSMWPVLFERMRRPLEAQGLEVVKQVWTQATPDGDLILPLLVWGYHFEPERWYGVVDALVAGGARLMNLPSVLRWNADKSYLQRLGEAGAPTVPSIAVEQLSEAALAEARRHSARSVSWSSRASPALAIARCGSIQASHWAMTRRTGRR